MIIPKVELVGVTLGALKVTRFVVLNVSNLNWKYLRSPSENFLSSDRSTFLVGSLRRLLNCVSNVRTLSANCWLETVLNRAVLKAWPLGWCACRFSEPP